MIAGAAAAVPAPAAVLAVGHKQLALTLARVSPVPLPHGDSPGGQQRAQLCLECWLSFMYQLTARQRHEKVEQRLNARLPGTEETPS